MSRHIVIDLPWPSRELHPNSRGHWSKRAKAAKDARMEAFIETRNELENLNYENREFDGKLILDLIFIPPDKRKRDDDGLISSFKPYRDGIADALGIDDNRFRTQVEVKDTTVKAGRVIVRIMQQPPAEALKAMGVSDVE